MKQKFPLLDGQLSISKHKEHSTGIYYNSRKSRFLFEDATIPCPCGTSNRNLISLH